jgi:pimeloyl-ACP methyl ester carboxylesterase
MKNISAPSSAGVLAALSLMAAVVISPSSLQAAAPSGKPTVVLVHGAFADSTGFDEVSTQLIARGYPVVAVANPLRGLHSDADYVGAIVDSIRGPVILVGHSYGGAVISNAATGRSNVKALVYVAGFAPEKGESALQLSAKFPGSTLGPTLTSVALPDGGKDLYIRQDKFHAQFAADVHVNEATVMGVNQRPVTQAALDEASGEPAWKTVPSWFLYGSLDKNIPPALHAFMAQRAHARKAVEVRGASHVVMMTHPNSLLRLIEEAARETRDVTVGTVEPQ